jgi:hypothetical protein
MKGISKILILIFCSILVGCNQIGNKTDSLKRISDYTKPTEDFRIDTGIVQFDMIPKSMTTHQLDSGSNLVFIYERTGVTMVDANDWEAKYTETLIFQLDSTIRDFEFCDTSLSQIDCKYYWICLTKEIKKEIIDIEKGCIKGVISTDSLLIAIDINSGFGFGGLMEKDKDRVIKYTTTRR